MAALLEEVVTILGPIRRDSYEGQTGHKVGHLCQWILLQGSGIVSNHFTGSHGVKETERKV